MALSICFSATPTSFASVLLCNEKQGTPLSKESIVSLAEGSFGSCNPSYSIPALQALSIATLYAAFAVKIVSTLPMGVACSEGMILSTQLITAVAAPVVAFINAMTKATKVAEEKIVLKMVNNPRPFKATYQRNFLGLKWGSQIAIFLSMFAHLSDYFLAGKPFVRGATYLVKRHVFILSVLFSTLVLLVTTIRTLVAKLKLNPDSVIRETERMKSELEYEQKQLENEPSLSPTLKKKGKVLSLQINTLQSSLQILSDSA